MIFKVEKIANMVFISSGETTFKEWDIEDFTERKFENAKNKIQKCYRNKVEFVRTF
jgi:hypothetical protein